MKMRGSRILITGGSSGIGRAIAHVALTKGARVVISGRRPEALADALRDLRTTSDQVWSVTANVGASEGRTATLKQALDWLGGLDILINNAGAVRAGRLEAVPEDEIEKMIAINLVGPILLTRAALPALRDSGCGMVVNITSGIALVGAPFYATYTSAKAGLAHFGESLRRELLGEGVKVLTAYPGPTDTPMMSSNRAGPTLGVVRESAMDVAAAIVEGIEKDALAVIRGGDAYAKMVALNRDEPELVDQQFRELKPAFEEAVRDHKSL